MNPYRAIFLTAGLVFCARAFGQAPAGVSAEELAKANDPTADLNGVNFTNYYGTALYGVPDATANTFNLRGVMISGRHIVRLTVPVGTTPTGRSTVSIPGQGSLPVGIPVGPVQSKSGLGDANIFDSIVLTPDGARTKLAVGPLLVAPSATNSALGSGKWQLGAAGVVVHPMPGGSMLAMLTTWQHSVAGDKDRPGTNLGSVQPIMTIGIGSGFYAKSSAVWLLDFRNDNYLIPVGVGFGKVTKIGDMLVNASIEPQFSVYHKGAGLPAFQLAAGVAFQWAKGGR